MERIVTMQGNVLTLQGQALKPGEFAPDFRLLDSELQEKELKDFLGNILVLLTVPSLDTSVCDLEVRRFNDQAAELDPRVQILAISMDLPFAQKRWCGQAGVERVTALSDHLNGNFGQSYGVLIKELRLLARAVFVVNEQGQITYIQLVSELTNEPDYEEVLAAIQRTLELAD